MKVLKKKEIKKLVNKQSNRDKTIFLILENIQYARNVASMFRTADAAGVRRVYLTGISHKPPFGKELSQVSRKKEESVEWMYKETSGIVINELKAKGFKIIAVELTDTAMELSNLSQSIRNDDKICFVLGSEVYGVTNATLSKCDSSVFIPMYGKGASLNVSSAGAIVLFSF
jgi:tRNA G18 (ribose-2'-O)-methylase SpoU